MIWNDSHQSWCNLPQDKQNQSVKLTVLFVIEGFLQKNAPHSLNNVASLLLRIFWIIVVTVRSLTSTRAAQSASLVFTDTCWLVFVQPKVETATNGQDAITDLTTDIVTNCCAVRHPSVTVPIRKETEKWNRTHRPQHWHGGACVSSWQHAVFTQQQGRWETKLLLPAHNVKAAQLETKTILCCGDGVFRHKHGGGDGDGVTVT